MKQAFTLSPKRVRLHVSALLLSAVMSLSAHAQTPAPADKPIVRVSDDWSMPGATAACNTGACGEQAAGSGNSRANDSSPAQARAHILPDSSSSPARNWKAHLAAGAHGETYECLLSLAIGGELKSGGGYLGAKLFGRTLTLNRPR